jgi:RNA polymerase sigma factor (TIGR02999 family)
VHAPNEIITVDDLSNLLGELRSMARNLLMKERSPRSLTPTALALSALRRAKAADADWEQVTWENRMHFFGILRVAMRHALIDHARRARRSPLTDSEPWTEDALRNLPEQADRWPCRIIDLHEALAIMRNHEARLAEVIEMHYFIGFSVPEIAAVSEVSEKTVDRELKRARTYLQKLLERLRAAH